MTERVRTYQYRVTYINLKDYKGFGKVSVYVEVVKAKNAEEARAKASGNLIDNFSPLFLSAVRHPNNMKKPTPFKRMYLTPRQKKLVDKARVTPPISLLPPNGDTVQFEAPFAGMTPTTFTVAPDYQYWVDRSNSLPSITVTTVPAIPEPFIVNATAGTDASLHSSESNMSFNSPLDNSDLNDLLAKATKFAKELPTISAFDATPKEEEPEPLIDGEDSKEIAWWLILLISVTAIVVGSGLALIVVRR